jgi:hypothetical protein
MSERDADKCFQYGRAIPCGKPAYADARTEACPKLDQQKFGWLDIWNWRGELSMREILLAKQRFFEREKDKRVEGSMDHTGRALAILKAEGDVAGGKVIVYQEPQIYWGFQAELRNGKMEPITNIMGTGTPDKQMNKVGRLWQFMEQPVTVKRTCSTRGIDAAVEGVSGPSGAHEGKGRLEY